MNNDDFSNENPKQNVDRRDFIKRGSLATLMAMMGGVELRAEDTAAKPAAAADTGLTPIPAGPPVNFGVIGLGKWGREVVSTLALLPDRTSVEHNAPVVAICDKYPAMVRRTAELAPKAEQFEDYKKLLEKKEVQAVVIATPSHQHKQIVLDALAAGKHVYCEAPLANTIEDAKEIARAAKNAPKQIFQAGLQNRCHPQRNFLSSFIRTGAHGKNILVRAQYHKNQSWRQASPNPEREKELNWRLHKATSTGLAGEIGIHQIHTVASWFLKQLPVAVTGWGSLIQWKDDRDVADSIQLVFEFPGGVQFFYDASLATAFDADYEIFHGTDGTILYRENKAWIFKEVNSPLLGWEVYARHDPFYKEAGIALIAGGSKQDVLTQKPTDPSPFPETELFYGLKTFATNCGTLNTSIDNFVATYGADDQAALIASLKDLKFETAPGWLDGLQATVMAIKANEAIVGKQRVVFEKEWFEI